jgi:rhodanese-related sulfurtransferase
LNTDFDCITSLKKLDPPLPESTQLAPRKATMEDRAMNLLSRWLRRLPTAPLWIEPAALAARLGRDAALLIIDVRGPDEFAGYLGHIRGATNMPLNELPAHLPDLVRENRPGSFEAGADIVLVIGGTGPGSDDHSAAALAEAGELAIHGVALRPGETAGLGRTVSGVPVVLLPGAPPPPVCGATSCSPDGQFGVSAGVVLSSLTDRAR